MNYDYAQSVDHVIWNKANLNVRSLLKIHNSLPYSTSTSFSSWFFSCMKSYIGDDDTWSRPSVTRDLTIIFRNIYPYREHGAAKLKPFKGKKTSTVGTFSFSIVQILWRPMIIGSVSLVMDIVNRHYWPLMPSITSWPILTNKVPANRWSLVSRMLFRKTKAQIKTKTKTQCTLYGAWWVTKFARLYLVIFSQACISFWQCIAKGFF